MDLFPTCFASLIGVEGGYTDNPADPGNWTGGATGAGVCRGTKYGISAASYPTLDIASLTLDQAQALYRAAYWRRASCDALPPMLAAVVFDSAVNNGVGRAVEWCQAALGVAADGQFGPASVLAAAKASGDGGRAAAIQFMARRALFMLALPTWPTFGAGWIRRLFTVAIDAGRLPVPS